MRGCGRWLLFVSLALGWPSSAFSQAFVEQLSPPALRRGAVTRLEVNGTETHGAVGLWTSLPAELLSVRCVEAAGPAAVFDIELKGEAPLGLYGLRLATRSGLSNVHLFLVDELPVTVRSSELSNEAVQAVLHKMRRVASSPSTDPAVGRCRPGAVRVGKPLASSAAKNILQKSSISS